MSAMKIFLCILFVTLSGYSKAADTRTFNDCQITFTHLSACQFQDIKVSVMTESLAADEKLLKSLQVTRHAKEYLLNITPDTAMLAGDKGVILFDDINFDGEPDLAISTSFGLANQYLDYWLFDTSKNAYQFIGNHTRFTLDTKSRTLTNEVKVNAATYEKHTFKWDGGVLKQTAK